ncbi:hypothetical protein J3P77_08920 [Pseudomonas sp. R1-18]|uniref:hypothetical protein n=1 Tax=Pseudomonas sp. R1-18 TaxID=1632772 RepID=UPI003DAA2D32
MTVLINDPTPSTAGSLVILDKDNAKYVVPGPPPGSGELHAWDLALPHMPCPNNVARKIQLGEFSSATRIELCDRVYPEFRNHEFLLVLMTTHKTTSTELIELETIFTYQEGRIVQPGLLLVNKYLRSGASIRDNLSYIKFYGPTTPP